MAKDPSLPALIADSGRVSIGGQVEFLAIDGAIVSYEMWPEIVARFARVATLVEQCKRMNDKALNLFADIDCLMCVFEARAAEARER